MAGVLGVHGIGNYERTLTPHDAAARLAAQWTEHLGSPMSMAYYAHHLHRGTAQGGGDDPGTLDDEAQMWFVNLVEELVPTVSIAQGPRTYRARQAAEWLTQHFGPIARAAVVAFCREVHTYLTKPDSPRRAAARSVVSNAIRTQRPDVVAAHSLGSIVAYEALWADPVELDLLVTLGSPLAMRGVVVDRLVPGEQRRPPGVRRWVNLADVGDLVALPKAGLGLTFEGVTQDLPVVIGDWDFHTSRAYLRCVDVRSAILGPAQ